jgi:hypothetical protein
MSLAELLAAADEPTRRAFLLRAAQGLFGLGAAPVLLGAQDPQPVVRLGHGSARRVIYLFLRGGMSQLDTFDTKPGAKTQGPVRSIATSADGVQVSEHLPLLARQMHHVAVLNSLTSTQGAHAQGQYFLRTSYTLRGTIQHPSVGAWANRLGGRLNPTLPGHVVIGAGALPTAGFLPPEFTALPIGDPDAGLQNSARARGVDEQTFTRRLELLARLDTAFAARHGGRKVDAYRDAYDDAVRLMRSADLVAFDLDQEPQALKDAYGDSNFGRGCLLARRLVEHDVRFVEVVNDGWDMHNQIFEALPEKCAEIDRGLAALLADLDARGLLRETLVVLATEFGRTPDLDGEREGRNHFPKAFSALLAGGGIRGGIKYGKTDAEGREVVERPVSVPDFNATIAKALGLPIDHVLHAPSGRPFTVADKGRPVTGLFA